MAYWGRIPQPRATVLALKRPPDLGSALCQDERIWRRRQESNLRLKVLQTFALPLGYAASGT